MGRLREQMKGDLELRGLSRSTQEIYLSQVRNFSCHFNRSPLHLGEREIKKYLLYLIREKSESTIAELQNPAQFSALLKDLYCREWVVYAKPPFKDPEMLLDYLGRYTHRGLPSAITASSKCRMGRFPSYGEIILIETRIK